MSWGKRFDLCLVAVYKYVSEDWVAQKKRKGLTRFETLDCECLDVHSVWVGALRVLDQLEAALQSCVTRTHVNS